MGSWSVDGAVGDVCKPEKTLREAWRDLTAGECAAASSKHQELREPNLVQIVQHLGQLPVGVFREDGCYRQTYLVPRSWPLAESEKEFKADNNLKSGGNVSGFLTSVNSLLRAYERLRVLANRSSFRESKLPASGEESKHRIHSLRLPSNWASKCLRVFMVLKASSC